MTASNLHLTFRDGGTGDAGDPYTGLDRFGRLVETLWKQDTGDRVRSKYGRNQVGGVVWRRDEAAHAQGKNTQDNYYGYDGLQQVKQRQRGDLTGPAPDYTGVTNLQQKEDWTHDATGNWAACSNTSPTNAQTRTHNTANEITEISAAPGDVEPAYDPVGNMLTLPKEPGTSTEQYDLVWDAWNRLVAVKDGGTVVASYTYDGLTRRQTKTNGAGTRHYYYNSQWRSVEERMNAGDTIDRQYTWGLHDRWDLLRRTRSVTPGSLNETLNVLRDYLDPVAIVDETGAVVERYAYDAFGNVRFLAPDYTSKSGSDFDWDFLFHAEFRDSVTNLYNYGYRYYDTNIGRWLNRDPMEMNRGNSYCMSRNNALAAKDILGLHESPFPTTGFVGYPNDPRYDQPGTPLCFDNEMREEPYSSLLKKIKNAGCSVSVVCKCDEDKADMGDTEQPNSSKFIRITVWYSLRKGPNPRTLLHELIHARDYCEGWLKRDCRSVVCSELKAYKAELQQFSPNEIDPLKNPPWKLYDYLTASAAESAQDVCGSFDKAWTIARQIYWECVPPRQNVF